MELFIESKTYGRFVVVYSAADDDIIQGHVWGITKNDNKYYVATKIKKADGKQTTKYLHSMIMGTHRWPKGFHTDHINGNTMDNRRENLRVCSHAENLENRGKTKSNTSGFKGVYANGNNWMAQIKYKGKSKYLGTFKIKEEAARAYDAAVIELRSVVTSQKLNFPEEYFK